MRDIEKSISPLVENMFPSFYKDEGPNFIAFVKAYYEWMEQSENPVSEARNVLSYRDIDTTTDKFILNFKEKYLKNIQFDTATNKKLLVKNSLDLYRSKGSENAIDLFFKLVYGTQAEVRNPGQNVLKLSDGVWEKPIYLEVSETDRNIDYVGKQIIGSLSGATSFVEKYINRKTVSGYVAILQISNLSGEFKKGEVISVILNGSQKTYENSPKLIGSMQEVIIQDGSRGFNIGDVVTIGSAYSGLGGLARVTSVSESTGAVDFIFIDGGWGYTDASAFSIVSEKVLFVENIIASPKAETYFSLFEPIVQPLVSLSFNNAEVSVQQGDSLYRVDGSNNIVAKATVLSANQFTTTTGELVVSPEYGAILADDEEYFVNSVESGDSLRVDAIQDRTIAGSLMGATTTYDLSITNQYGGLAVGDTLYQVGSTAEGTVSAIASTPAGNVAVLTNASGAFKNSFTTYSVLESNKLFDPNSDVDETSGVWSIAIPNNTFANNDLVRYVTASGSVAIPGLTNNSLYFVVGATTSEISLSETRDGSKVAIQQHPDPLSSDHTLQLNNLNVAYARVSGNSSFIFDSADYILIKNNTNLFKVGDIVRYTVDAGISPITGLTSGTDYFVVYADSDGIRLSNRYNGSPISISPIATNTVGHTFTGRMSIRARTPAGTTLPDFYADFENVNMNIGVYDIKRSVYNINYSSASNSTILAYGNNIYQYDASGKVSASAKIVTVEIDSVDDTVGLISAVPTFGTVFEGENLYTDANAASASVTSISNQIRGGDYVITSNTKMITLRNGTQMSVPRQSTGFGAGFNVTGIGESESILINTDIINANGVSFISSGRTVLGMTNPGFNEGDTVVQYLKSNFQGNTTSVLSNGFITMTTTGISEGSILEYYAATTPIKLVVNSTSSKNISNGAQFIAKNVTASGLSLLQNLDDPVVANLVATTANTNHFFLKVEGGGTVVSETGGGITVADVYGNFQVTASGYGNVMVYGTSSTNAAITGITESAPASIIQKPFLDTPIRSSGYGFAKNPNGNLNDTIFGCLSYNKFNIGTISGISGVDPGSNYNTDPYVLVYQPYIAQFNRKDYVFDIANITGTFVPGEKLTQSTGALTFFDLEVTGGVKDADYNAITRNIDPKYDVDASNEFIYVPFEVSKINSTKDVGSLRLSFNSLNDVDGVQNFVFIQNNPYVDGDSVLYLKDSATGIGLSNNTSYFVVSANTSGIKLSSSAGGDPVVLNKTIDSSTQHYFSKTAANYISVQDHGYSNGMIVRYYRDTGNTQNIGLADGSLYKVANTGAYGFNLANVATSTAIALTSGGNEEGHTIKGYFNGSSTTQLIFNNADRILYNKYVTGDTDIGPDNGNTYFVIAANTLGFKITTTPGVTGDIVNLSSTASSESSHYIGTVPGYLAGDRVYQDIEQGFNAQSNVSSNRITIANSPFANNDRIRYFTGTSGTAITGSNNAYYYAMNANSSGLQLKSTLESTTPVTLTAAGSSQTHTLETIPTASISSVFTQDGDSFVRINSVTQTFLPNYQLKSNTNIYVDNNVTSVTPYSELKVAQGIVKSANTSTVLVKRINFENTFIPGESISGEFSGTSATLISVTEDANSASIGTNANIQANVVTANGTITNLQVIDSGIGYSNSEIVQYTSQDGARSGTGKVVIDGSGQSRGYYKSTRGFLSNDQNLHDGDYYQEYSYEILTKVSFDRYQDMFKKVLHVAGTRVFGSALVIEENEKPISVKQIETSQIIEFNPKLDIFDSSIEVGLEKIKSRFNSAFINATTDLISLNEHQFKEGERVRYITDTGTVPNIGLSNNQIYYIKNATPSGFSLSTTRGGNKIPLTPTNVTSLGHNIQSYTNPFKNGDFVEYYTDYRTFNSKTDVDNDNDFIRLQDNIFDSNDYTLYQTTPATRFVTKGLISGKSYYVLEANTAGVKLSNAQRYLGAVFLYPDGSNDLEVHLVDSRNFGDVNLTASPKSLLPIKEIDLYGQELELQGVDYDIIADNVSARMYTKTGEEIILFTFDETVGGTTPGSMKVYMYNASESYDPTAYFNQTGEGNVTRYRLTSKGLTVFNIPGGIDYIFTDGNLDVLPNTSQGFLVDLFNTKFEFGRSEIRHIDDFIIFDNEMENVADIDRVIVFDGINDVPGSALINLPNHGLVLGDLVQYTKDSSATAVGGLTPGSTYYVVYAIDNYISLSTSYPGVALNVTAATTGTGDSYLSYIKNPNSVFKFNNGDLVEFTHPIDNISIGGLNYAQQYYVTQANTTGFKLTGNNPNFELVPNLPAAIDSDFMGINNNKLSNGMAVKYFTAKNTLPIVPLVNNSIYYVVSSNTTGIKLAETINGAVINVTSVPSFFGHNVLAQFDEIDITKTSASFDSIEDVKDNQDFIILLNNPFVKNDRVIYTVDSGYTAPYGISPPVTFKANTQGIDESNRTITVTGNQFVTGQQVMYYTSTGNTVIEGLSNNGIYYVANSEVNTLKLKETPLDYPIPIQNGSNESGHNLVPVYYIAQSNTIGVKVAFSPNGSALDIGPATSGSSGVGSTFEKLESDSGYKFTLINNDTGAGHILYKSIPIAGLDFGRRYYVVDSTETTIKISETLSGQPISLYSTRNEVGHYLKKIVEE